MGDRIITVPHSPDPSRRATMIRSLFYALLTLLFRITVGRACGEGQQQAQAPKDLRCNNETIPE